MPRPALVSYATADRHDEMARLCIGPADQHWDACVALGQPQPALTLWLDSMPYPRYDCTIYPPAKYSVQVAAS